MTSEIVFVLPIICNTYLNRFCMHLARASLRSIRDFSMSSSLTTDKHLVIVDFDASNSLFRPVRWRDISSFTRCNLTKKQYVKKNQEYIFLAGNLKFVQTLQFNEKKIDELKPRANVFLAGNLKSFTHCNLTKKFVEPVKLKFLTFMVGNLKLRTKPYL